MVKFEGKYELEKSVDQVEYLRSLGQEISEDAATQIREGRTVLFIEDEGEGKYRFSRKSTSSNHVLSFSIGKPFQETVQGTDLDDIAKQEGNKITITSTVFGRTFERIFEFSDDGLVEINQSPETTVVSRQYFKRM